MAAISCPSCGKTLNVTEQYAGKKVRCPNCQGVLTVPPLSAPPTAQLLTSEEVVPVAPRPPARPAAPAMPPLPPAHQDPTYPPPAPRRPDDYDDRGRRGPPPRYGNDDRRFRRPPGMQWAPCPSCGNDDATRVHWTFWGGMIGPAIINVVRCHRCGASYNGVHGDYNGGRIAIYVVISIVIGLVIAGIGIAVAVANG